MHVFGSFYAQFLCHFIYMFYLISYRNLLEKHIMNANGKLQLFVLNVISK